MNKPISLRDIRFRTLLKRLSGGAAGGVFKGTLMLLAGSGAARVISFAVMPVLTRIYGPENFGILAVFTALVAILAPLATLRYALALPLPRHDGTAMNLLVLSLGLMTAISLLIALALWGFGTALLGLFSMEALMPWWWLVALGVLTTALYELLTLWATRKRAYRILAGTNVWQSIAGAIVMIGLGLLSFKPGGLLLGRVVSQSGGIGSLFRNFCAAFERNWRHVRPSRLNMVARRYVGFPIWRVPSQFLLILSQQAPLMFVAMFYNPNTTGQLSLTLSALAVPVSLLGGTAAKAFYAEASQLGPKRPDEIRRILIDILYRLSIVSVPPTLLLFLFGEQIFPLVFGTAWEQAGTFASILSIYMLLQFLQTPVSFIFYIFDGQRPLLLLNLQRVLLVALVFYLADRQNWGVESAVWSYAIALGLHYGLSIVYAFRFIPKKG